MGKYFVALVGSSSRVWSKDVTSKTAGEAPLRRYQLGVLYLVNDLLHHSKYHSKQKANRSTWPTDLEPFLIDLFDLPVPKRQGKPERGFEKIRDLLEFWHHEHFFSDAFVGQLKEKAFQSSTGASGGDAHSQDINGSPTRVNATQSVHQDDPFLMPALHGDSAMPYYDLPAGNLMPHITPNSSMPINSQMVKPMQLPAGPAEDSLIAIVQAFLDEVEPLIKSSRNGKAPNIDELGQPVKLDEITGEILGGESYYGWSRPFCEKMKRRGRGERGISASVSPERDRVVRKRRRSSDYSDASSRSRDATARFPPPIQRRRRSFSRSRSSSSDSSHPSNPQHRKPSRHPQSRSRSSSRSYSPPQALPPSQQVPAFQTQSQGQIPGPPGHGFYQSSYHNAQGLPFGPNGLPPPPPPPPDYKGPWPPPPPPLAPNLNFAQQGFVARGGLPHSNPGAPHPSSQQGSPQTIAPTWDQGNQQRRGQMFPGSRGGRYASR